LKFVKDTKAKVAADHAQRAAEEGHAVFLYRVKAKWSDPGMTGPVTDFAEQIEAIESVGWKLNKMAMSGDEKTPAGYFLFRR
jgi:hypothetical protein